MTTDPGARAAVLTERARLAIDRSRELAKRIATNRARIAEARAGTAAARRARLVQRAAPAGMRWARAVRGFIHGVAENHQPSWPPLTQRAPAGRSVQPGVASGRVVWRAPRRREAAAHEAAGEIASGPGDGEPPDHRRLARLWAQATARAERVIHVDGVPVGVAGASGRALTPREAEVLWLVVRGHANKEIAATLAIGVKTVETHKANGMAKLGLATRAALVRFALDQGWLATG